MTSEQFHVWYQKYMKKTVNGLLDGSIYGDDWGTYVEPLLRKVVKSAEANSALHPWGGPILISEQGAGHEASMMVCVSLFSDTRLELSFETAALDMSKYLLSQNGDDIEETSKLLDAVEISLAKARKKLAERAAK